jgi:hypothetical protein
MAQTILQPSKMIDIIIVIQSHYVDLEDSLMSILEDLFEQSFFFYIVFVK